MPAASSRFWRAPLSARAPSRSSRFASSRPRSAAQRGAVVGAQVVGEVAQDVKRLAVRRRLAAAEDARADEA